MKNKLVLKSFVTLLCLFVLVCNAYSQASVTLDNKNLTITVDTKTGAISSFFVKKNKCDLISEKKLAANFTICLPLKEYTCNYIDGMEQKPVSVTKNNNVITVEFSGMHSSKGTYPIDLSYTITLNDDYASFKSKLTNNDSLPISEFWFPRIGGMTDFGENREAILDIPYYNKESMQFSLFRNYPGIRSFGAEAAEWSYDYPGVYSGMPMPWWDIYDAKNNVGLYLGYHDTICRRSTWHTYLKPDITGASDPWFTKEQAAGQPIGLVFSHLRYPFVKSGETLESGEFIIRVHEGDWHNGSQFYRKWFMSHFPFDNSKSWLRKQSSWFASILMQPEDRIETDYKGYNQWTKDAKEFGIGCYELIGWWKGGLERNYPEYIPEDKLGGNTEFKNLLKSIKDRGDHCLVFINYNVLDISTDWYKKELHKYVNQNEFGNQKIYMAWGHSTFIARHQESVRLQVRSSIVPRIEEIMEGYFLKLVKDGAQGFQLDKIAGGFNLDFNPMNTLKPDVAACEGQIQAIDRVFKKCKAINPDFRIASEAGLDRYLPYFDVFYRAAKGYGTSTLRYVFPEWTSCAHIGQARDFRGVNGAVMTGSVICIEPNYYQSSIKQAGYSDIANYIKEVESIRKILADDIFLAKYYDNQLAKIQEYNETSKSFKPSDLLKFKVHGNLKTDKLSIVVANDADNTRQYVWEFTNRKVENVTLYSPFEEAKTIKNGDVLTIKGTGLHILVEN